MIAVEPARIMRRVGGLQARVSRWASIRKKDLLWLARHAEFERAAPALLAAHDWVFVVGCNNSGTTLVHDALAATGAFSYMPHEGQRYTDGVRRSVKRGHERVWSEYLDELRLTERTNINLQGYMSPSLYSKDETDLRELRANKYQATLGLRHRVDNHVWTIGITENLQNINNTPDIGFQVGFAWVPKIARPPRPY